MPREDRDEECTSSRPKGAWDHAPGQPRGRKDTAGAGSSVRRAANGAAAAQDTDN